MLAFLEVFVHDTLMYMAQKYLVDSNRHHLMINSWMYNRVFVVYFYFVRKMGNFFSDPVRDVYSHGSLLSLMMYFESFIFVKINDFVYFFGGNELFVMD